MLVALSTCQQVEQPLHCFWRAGCIGSLRCCRAMTCVLVRAKSHCTDMLLRCQQPELGVLSYTTLCDLVPWDVLSVCTGLLEVRALFVLRVLVHSTPAVSHMSERMPVAVLSCTMAERAHGPSKKWLHLRHVWGIHDRLTSCAVHALLPGCQTSASCPKGGLQQQTA